MEILLILFLIAYGTQNKRPPDLSILTNAVNFLNNKDPESLLSDKYFSEMKIGGIPAADLIRAIRSVKEYAGVLPGLFNSPTQEKETAKQEPASTQNTPPPDLSAISSLADDSIAGALNRYFS